MSVARLFGCVCNWISNLELHSPWRGHSQVITHTWANLNETILICFINLSVFKVNLMTTLPCLTDKLSISFSNENSKGQDRVNDKNNKRLEDKSKN